MSRYKPSPSNGIIINIDNTVIPTNIRCIIPATVNSTPIESCGKMLLDNAWLIPTVNKRIPPRLIDFDFLYDY